MEVGELVLARTEVCQGCGSKLTLFKVAAHHQVDWQHDEEAHKGENELVGNNKTLEGKVFVASFSNGIHQKLPVKEEPLFQRIALAKEGVGHFAHLICEILDLTSHHGDVLAMTKSRFELVQNWNVELGPDEECSDQSDDCELDVPDEPVEDGIEGTVLTDGEVLGGCLKLFLDLAAHFRFFFLGTAKIHVRTRSRVLSVLTLSRNAKC